jgi:putative tryptophan/tyrosine transport system substrate-binding protein
MNRRGFIVLVGGAAVARPQPAHAEQAGKPLIGFLNILSPSTTQRFVAAFHQGLKETGYVEGENIAIEYCWAEGDYKRLPAMADGLVHRNVAAIFAVSPPAVLAAKAATTKIPIVFLSGLDPVVAGFVASLSRPGGNVTGVSLVTSALGAKRLELLRDLVPAATRIALLVNPTNPNTEVQVRDAEAAARNSARRIQVLNASTESAIDTAFASLARERPDAVIVGADPFFTSRRDQIVGLMARHAIPAIYDWREYAFAGGLMSYGTSLPDSYRLAATYVGRILKGATPDQLPVVQPTQFELVVNLKTARSLGLTVPRILMVSANEVIQ